MPVEEVTYKAALHEEDLFVQVSADDWRPLFPFMTAHECPKCHHSELYFIDKWNGAGESAYLKSFDQGHVLQSSDEGAALADRMSPS